MLEIPSIIRIIAEIDLLKLYDLEPQGYKVRDSNYFKVDFPKFSHILQYSFNSVIYCNIHAIFIIAIFMQYSLLQYSVIYCNSQYSVYTYIVSYINYLATCM